MAISKSSSKHSRAVTPKKSPNRKKTTASKSSKAAVVKTTGTTYRNTPRWLLLIYAAGIVVCFSFLFYYFFIRPYAYRWRPCNGFKAYGVCIPLGYDVHGIDISHHQGVIDWESLAALQEGIAPVRFVFMKATEGGDHLDDRFAENFSNARTHGFIRGAYHFFNPMTDALKQADFFIRTVQLEKGDLPPVLDVETTRKKKKEALQEEVGRWLKRVEGHYGVKPILYTSYKFKTRYLDDSLFNAYPYWIAHYYVDSVEYQGTWNFWQHTDVGSVPGIGKEVDLDVFNGTLEELKALTIQE